LFKELKETSVGLFYISETDAPFESFIWKRDDKNSTDLNAEDVLKLAGQKPDAKVEERTVDNFFAQSMTVQDWFGEEEKNQVEKFSKLKELLEGNLKNVKVFKIGEINIDIYVAGVDAEGNVIGVQTKAVET
jgi:hypothetical protein